jgi:hypothetical protein
VAQAAEKSRPIFSELTLKQVSSLSLIKTMISNPLMLNLFESSNLPIELKNISHVARALTCIQKLYGIENLEDENVLGLAFTKGYTDRLKIRIESTKKKIEKKDWEYKNIPAEEQEKKALKELAIDLQEFELLRCVKEHMNVVLEQFNLSYLFLVLIHDPSLQALFLQKNVDLDQNRVEELFRTTLYFLAFKGRWTIVKNLLEIKELSIPVLTIFLDTLPTAIAEENLLKDFETEFEDKDFLRSFNAVLKDFVMNISITQLTESSNELADIIISYLIDRNDFDKIASILDVLFSRGISANVMISVPGAVDKISLVYKLFNSLFVDEDDSLTLEKIIYLVKNGLSIDVLKEPVSDTDVLEEVRKAKINYNRLRKERPDQAIKLEESRLNYYLKAAKQRRENKS